MNVFRLLRGTMNDLLPNGIQISNPASPVCLNDLATLPPQNKTTQYFPLLITVIRNMTADIRGGNV